MFRYFVSRNSASTRNYILLIDSDRFNVSVARCRRCCDSLSVSVELRDFPIERGSCKIEIRGSTFGHSRVSPGNDQCHWDPSKLQAREQETDNVTGKGAKHNKGSRVLEGSHCLRNLFKFPIHRRSSNPRLGITPFTE